MVELCVPCKTIPERSLTCGCDRPSYNDTPGEAILASLTYVDGTCVKVIRARSVRSNNTSGWGPGRENPARQFCPCVRGAHRASILVCPPSLLPRAGDGWHKYHRKSGKGRRTPWEMGYRTGEPVRPGRCLAHRAAVRSKTRTRRSAVRKSAKPNPIWANRKIPFHPIISANHRKLWDRKARGLNRPLGVTIPSMTATCQPGCRIPLHP